MLEKSVKRYCELANKKTERLYTVSHPCLDDHQIKKGELENKGELSKVCSHIVLKCLYLVRLGRSDILFEFLENEHLYRSVGCARSKRQCLTAPRNRRSYRWMLVCVWTVHLRLTYGIWSLKCWERPKEYQNQPKHARGKPVLRPKSQPRFERVLDQNVDRSNMDQVPSNAHLSEKESQLYVYEDNEAVIKKNIKGRSPTIRHVSRTHRVALDWSE